jgi:FkbM family methyltransferase
MTIDAQTQKILITNKIGRQMWVWDSDSFYTQRLQAGPYQKQNLIHLRELCPNPRKILDIGMNIGMNTWEYATFAQEVHSFEPVPTTYQVGLDNIALNQHHQDPATGWWKNNDGTWASLAITGRINTYNVALGPEAGNVEMHIKKNDGHNRVSNDGYKTVTGKEVKVNTGYQRVSVPQLMLDSYNFTDVDIIKIDVEGYELNVLQGATNTLLTNRPIVQVECVETQPRAFGNTIQDLMDFFTERDYVITTADGIVRGTEWCYVKKMMDRFMIPKERTDLYDLNKLTKDKPVKVKKVKEPKQSAKAKKAIENAKPTPDSKFDEMWEF